jgi:dTDP-4-dehydrorhamnose 3,5-epimerase-like enzyme
MRLTVHHDDRGSVRETYRASWFPEMPPIVQLVRSESRPRTLRGLHRHEIQWDVWHIISGRAVVRLDDALIEADPSVTLIVPPGTEHGFYTEAGCVLLYGLTREYDGTDEYGRSPFDGLPGWPSGPDGLRVSKRDLEA